MEDSHIELIEPPFDQRQIRHIHVLVISQIEIAFRSGIQIDDHLVPQTVQRDRFLPRLWHGFSGQLYNNIIDRLVVSFDVFRSCGARLDSLPDDAGFCQINPLPGERTDFLLHHNALGARGEQKHNQGGRQEEGQRLATIHQMSFTVGTKHGKEKT